MQSPNYNEIMNLIQKELGDDADKIIDKYWDKIMELVTKLLHNSNDNKLEFTHKDEQLVKDACGTIILSTVFDNIIKKIELSKEDRKIKMLFCFSFLASHIFSTIEETKLDRSVFSKAEVLKDFKMSFNKIIRGTHKKVNDRIEETVKVLENKTSEIVH